MGNGHFTISEHLQHIAHHASHNARRQLVHLAFTAINQNAENSQRTRRGPKGDEVTLLAGALCVSTRTVKYWREGKLPGDHSIAKLLRFLILQDHRICDRLSKIILSDLQEYTDAVAQFHTELPITGNQETGTSPFHESNPETAAPASDAAGGELE